MAKGAPIGNQFWKLRSKHGRDKIFGSADIMWEESCKYFQWCDDNPLMAVEQSRQPGKGKKQPEISDRGISEKDTGLIELPKMRAYILQGLCIFLGVNTKYFNDFADGLKGKDDKDSKDFSEVVTRIRDVIYTQKFTGAAAGLLNQNIIAKDLGLVDRKQVEINEQPLFPDES